MRAPRSCLAQTSLPDVASTASRVLPVPGGPVSVRRRTSGCRGEPDLAQLLLTTHERCVARGRRPWPLRRASVFGSCSRIARSSPADPALARSRLSTTSVFSDRPVGRQSVRLSTRAIEREHSWPRSRSRYGCAATSAVELGDEARRSTGRSPRRFATLDGVELELLEPGSLPPGERLVREIGERRPSPQRESLTQTSTRCRWLQLPGLLHKTLEAPQVELVVAHSESVPRSLRHDSVSPEQFSQMRDVDPKRCLRGLRRLLAPRAHRSTVESGRARLRRVATRPTRSAACDRPTRFDSPSATTSSGPRRWNSIARMILPPNLQQRTKAPSLAWALASRQAPFRTVLSPSPRARLRSSPDQPRAAIACPEAPSVRRGHLRRSGGLVPLPRAQALLSVSTAYDFLGSPQPYVVPAGICRLRFAVFGAAGGPQGTAGTPGPWRSGSVDIRRHAGRNTPRLRRGLGRRSRGLDAGSRRLERWRRGRQRLR